MNRLVRFSPMLQGLSFRARPPSNSNRTTKRTVTKHIKRSTVQARASGIFAAVPGDRHARSYVMVAAEHQQLQFYYTDTHDPTVAAEQQQSQFYYTVSVDRHARSYRVAAEQQQSQFYDSFSRAAVIAILLQFRAIDTQDPILVGFSQASAGPGPAQKIKPCMKTLKNVCKLIELKRDC